MSKLPQGIQFRYDPTPADSQRIREIVESTGFFYGHEVDVAVELVDERLAKGLPSGYRFVFADPPDGPALGYACFGHIACTAASYDLYWIAVDDASRGLGLGRILLAEAERQIAALGGKRVYIETSDREQYLPTRAFYERCDYTAEATLVDFYGPDDSKVIYVKALG